MSTLITVKQVKSLTVGFTFPETYDMSRAEEIKVYLGKNVYPHTIDGRVVKCQIKSDDTAVMYGANRLSFWLDDSIIGVYPVYCGNIIFEYTNAIEHNESVNTLFDVMVNLTISETAITVDSVLYNILKGDKGDPFTYSDFTPEQIAELQQPATDAIASIQEVELAVETAEGLRQQAELNRQTNTATAIQNAEQATDDANDAAILANEKAGLANDAATLANTKAGLADNAATNANTKAGLADAAATNANNVANGYAAELAAKELKANKQNNLAPDGTGTKFPTVDAVNAGLEGSNLIYQYTHSGNKEIYITRIDYATKTFTSANHGLVNNDRITIKIIGNATIENVIPFRGGIPTEEFSFAGFVVVNATQDTFQISSINGGAAITLYEKATSDFSKWRFEKLVPTNITLPNIPNIGCVIDITGDMASTPKYIFPNGVINSWGYTSLTATTIGVVNQSAPYLLRGIYTIRIVKTNESYCMTRKHFGVNLSTTDQTKILFVNGENYVVFKEMIATMTSVVLNTTFFTNGTVIKIYKL